MNNQEALIQQLRVKREPVASEALRRIWPWLVLTGVVAGAILVWRLLSAQVPAPVQTIEAIAVSHARAGDSVLDANGYVTARRQATVSSMITGRVAQVLIEEGQHVEQGQVLAMLDDIDARARLGLSRAERAAARAQLGEVQSQLAQAEREWQRQRDLEQRGIVARVVLEAAQTQRDSLVARLRSVERQADVAKEALRVAEIGVYHTTIRAPFAGVVTVKAAQPGEMISPISAGGGFTRTGIGTIVDMESLEVQVEVNEAYIGRVRPGQAVEAVLNAYPDWKIAGTVIAIVPTADRGRATVKVRVALQEKDARIVPDMGVRVAFLDAGRSADADVPAAAGVRVPSQAIVSRAGSEVAFVVLDGRVELRRVAAQPERAGMRTVTAGIAAGEAVVMTPADTLQDGAAVEL
jgi:RND family efflux transporter MFP subunit